MSGNEREGLRERLEQIEAEMARSDPRFVSKEVREIVELGRKVLSLLTQAQEPVAWGECEAGRVIRDSVDHDPETMRFYLTCSVGTLAQRLVASAGERKGVLNGSATPTTVTAGSPAGASPVASAPRGYDPANEPEALNFLHNIFDLVKHGERAVMDFLALHGDRIQELVTASAPEEEREGIECCTRCGADAIYSDPTP